MKFFAKDKMTELKKLLELREKIKAKKPDFIRQDTHKRKKLTVKWRKPKGIHSKIRHHFKGRGKMPSPGYKSPRQVKGLNAAGLKVARVFTVDNLEKVNKEKVGIVIPKDLGMKKRFEILKKAKELNIAVLNFSIDDQIKKIEDMIDSKRKKEVKETKMAQVKDQKAAKDNDPKNLTANISDEQKNEAEKKEKDKILTKKT